MQLQLDEVRRLTGPNLLWDKPGALIDAFVGRADQQQVVECWQSWMQKCLAEFNWGKEQTAYRLHAEGVNLAVSAPIDALYTACELAELAWDCCAAELLEQTQASCWMQRIAELRVELAAEVNPDLLALVAAADQQRVTCLTDDDDVSLGLGASAEIWPVATLPRVEQIEWQKYSDIPAAFVTGTNGKSTSVRLAAEIARAAGMNAGITSTDFIRVGDDIIDRGDYSGPGGARILLRDNRTEIAFMEVARGGLLRRGLPVSHVDAALITNVASDHLGQYGINTVEELAEVKFIVAKALDSQGVLVVNADNDLVVAQAAHTSKTFCWFSTDQQNELIQQQIKSGGRAVFIREGSLIYHQNGNFEELCTVAAIPMTFNGSAVHNIQNALGVVGLCKALNLPVAAIKQGLQSFGSNAEDNPGRGNLYSVQGCKVIVDFAHNEHSMRAVAAMVQQMSANNRIVMFSHGGDRSDQEIRDLTSAVVDLNASHYITAEVENYLRGREFGEIPALVETFLVEQKVAKQQIQVASDPLQGSKLALSLAKPGDVVTLFVLDQREEVHDWLSTLND